MRNSCSDSSLVRKRQSGEQEDEDEEEEGEEVDLLPRFRSNVN